MINMHIGEAFKKRIEAKYNSVEDFSHVCNVDADRIEKLLQVPLIKGSGITLTTTEFFRICNELNIDEDNAIVKNIIIDRNIITPFEILEELEPGGTGTIEQRIIRLIAHVVISRGRGAEILGVTRYDLPKMQSTGCTCLNCRTLVDSINNGD